MTAEYDSNNRQGTESDAFLKRIWEKPDDDGPRLIFADWLNELDSPFGTFIRLQCALEGLPREHPDWSVLKRQELSLLAQHQKEWESPIRNAIGAELVRIQFKRGLPDALVISSVSALAESRVLQHFPITHLTINNLKTSEMPILAELINSSKVTTLDISFNPLGPEAATHLAKMTGLQSLNIQSTNILPGGAAQIARMSNLTDLIIGYPNTGMHDLGMSHIAGMRNLRRLDISASLLSDSQAQILAGMKGLDSLNVYSTQLSQEAIEFISRMSGLTGLGIANNNIGPEGAAAIARMKNLTFLNISGNRIGESGAASIATMKKLATLNVSSNELYGPGTEHIASMANLKKLNISRNRVGFQGADRIKEMQNLESLDISDNVLGSRGASHIAQMHNLYSLSVENNRIDSESAALISRMSKLHTLNVALNNIDESGIRQIVGMRNLVELNAFQATRTRSPVDVPRVMCEAGHPESRLMMLNGEPWLGQAGSGIMATWSRGQSGPSR